MEGPASAYSRAGAINFAGATCTGTSETRVGCECSARGEIEGNVMGCDIHMYPEVRRNGAWEFVYEFDTTDKYWTKVEVDEIEAYDRANRFSYDDRNYSLFGHLAGVRGGDPFIEPKGFPDDASAKVKHQYSEDNGDAHTPSWLTLKELQSFNWKKADNYGVKGFPAFEEVIDRLASLDPDPENVRVVFWFDN